MESNVTQANANADKLVGCALAIVASTVEVAISIALKSPATSDIIAMLVGVVSGCVLGALSSKASLAAKIFQFPVYGAIVAALTDLITQWVCASRTNQWDRFDYRHALAIGLGTLAIGLAAGSVGGFLPEAGTAWGLFQQGLGIAAVSGEYAGVLDLRLNGGTSC